MSLVDLVPFSLVVYLSESHAVRFDHFYITTTTNKKIWFCINIHFLSCHYFSFFFFSFSSQLLRPQDPAHGNDETQVRLPPGQRTSSGNLFHYISHIIFCCLQLRMCLCYFSFLYNLSKVHPNQCRTLLHFLCEVDFTDSSWGRTISIFGKVKRILRQREDFFCSILLIFSVNQTLASISVD